MLDKKIEACPKCGDKLTGLEFISFCNNDFCEYVFKDKYFEKTNHNGFKSDSNYKKKKRKKDDGLL